jgi:diguanylate cyclase (GGDEF)-like protein
MFDVDHFKSVNDTYGHLAGDYVLAELAKLGIQTVRAEDVFARYGGEEFAVVARGLTMFQGYQFGERLRSIVADCRFVHEGTHIPVTISVGVASYPEIPVDTFENLVSAADSALYSAKRNGRNRVEMAR